MNMQLNRKALTPLIALATISVLTFLCFLPDLKNGLLAWDDAGYILDNIQIQSLSIETVRSAFFTSRCDFWAPLTWLSLAFDYAAWGLNPLGYHLTNNILHALNASLFFCLSRELLTVHMANAHPQVSDQAARDESTVLWCSLLAALIFALHPLRVESVAWTAERKDVLSLFFGIPAVLAYLRHARSRKSQTVQRAHSWLAFVHSTNYWLAFFFSLLSLMSKPMLVTLPIVLLILDWYPLGRFREVGTRAILAEKFVFFITSGLVSSIITLSHRNQLVSLEFANWTSRILNAANSVVSYLWLTVWPVDISPFYLHPGNISILSPRYALSALFVIAATIAFIVLARKQPFPLAVWLIYLTTLFPVLGFTQVGAQAMAARFTYAPSLPVSLCIAVMSTKIIFRKPQRSVVSIATGLAIGCVLLFYSEITVRHISYWKDDVALWSRVIDLAPGASGRAYFQRGQAYFMKGENRLALADMNSALDIAMRKKYRALYEIYQKRAIILASLGDCRDAIADCTRALETAGTQERAVILSTRKEISQRCGQLENIDASSKQSRQSGL